MWLKCERLSMPYQLAINTDAGYVHLTYSGVVDLPERKQAKEAVFNACHENKLHRSLVDLRNSDIKMSESDVITFASSFKNTTLPDGYRLAAVISPDNQTDNLIEIIISIDGIDVKYFFDINEATNWLIAI